MLELKELAHLRQAEPLIGQLVADGPGLVVVADPKDRIPRPLRRRIHVSLE